MVQMSDQIHRKRLELELSILLLLLVVTYALTGLVDPDLGGHVQYGLDHLRDGRLPLRDPYSFTVTANDVWINHEWLFELIAAWLFKMFGTSGLILLQALTWGLSAGIVLWLSKRSGARFVPLAILYLLFVVNAIAAITIRPQLFSYLLFAVLLLLLEQARSGRLKLLGLVPIVFLVWVNVHGGFLAGLCVLGAYAGGLALDAVLKRSAAGDLDKAPKRPGLLAALTFASLAGGFLLTFGNPYRDDLWRFLGDSLGRPRAKLITEWQSVALDPQGIALVLMIVLVAVALLVREFGRNDGGKDRRVPLAHVLVLLGTAVVAVRHIRHAPFFAIAACTYATGAWGQLYGRFVQPPDTDLEQRDLRRFRVLSVLLLAPCLATTLMSPSRDLMRLTVRPSGYSTFPTGAIRYMHEHDVRGNLLVDFDWAQLIIFEFHPRVHVFYDGRFRTVYDQELEDVFFSFRFGEEGWRKALTDYPTEWVLIPEDQPGLASPAVADGKLLVRTASRMYCIAR